MRGSRAERADMQTRLLHFPSAMNAGTNLILEGARVARSPYSAKYRTLFLRGTQIESIIMPGVADLPHGANAAAKIDLTGYVILPGLINAHDHLDFSLFPRLGQGPYPGWREWAADIHRSQQSLIQEYLRVPRDARIFWGGIRNLLSGVTTVSHHNPYQPHLFDDGFPVRVLREYGWVHSLVEIHRVGERFQHTPPAWPFIIHLAEGTDETSQKELDLLQSLVSLEERLVLVHCVGLTPRQCENVARSGVGVVWCPSSNLYTLGKTLAVEQLSNFPNLALGTDSPLTAKGDLLDEIRLVHKQIGLPASVIYELVTTRAARLLQLRNGEGTLQVGTPSDLVVARDRQLMPAETLVQLSWRDLELVMQDGRIVLLSPVLAERVPKPLKQGMEWISVDGTARLLRAPIAELLSKTHINLGRAPSICGRELSLIEPRQSPRHELVSMSGSNTSMRSQGSFIF